MLSGVVDWIHVAQDTDPMANSLKHANKPSSIKVGEFIDQLSD
jgi:hypothetical protein